MKPHKCCTKPWSAIQVTKKLFRQDFGGQIRKSSPRGIRKTRSFLYRTERNIKNWQDTHQYLEEKK